MSQRKLDARESRFVEEYLVDLDPKRAAIAAKYSKTMAHTKAYQWVSSSKLKPHVYAAIQAGRDKLTQRTELSQEMVIAEMRRIGFSDIRKVVKWGERPINGNTDDDARAYPVELVSSEDIDDDTAAAISEVALTSQGVKIKMYDKQSALLNLGKHLGAFPTRLEHGGPNGGPIQIELKLTPSERARRLIFMFEEAKEEMKQINMENKNGD